MAYSDKEKQKIFDNICEIIVSGKSLRSALLANNNLPASTFFVWMREDKQKSKQYARATEERAEMMFEEMFDIADESSGDYIEQDLGDGVVSTKLNGENIQRSRLRVDTRKWALSKLMPKKYGDKIDVTSGNEKINYPPVIVDSSHHAEMIEKLSDE